ncbi:hypothetical protein B0H17DRAFT_1148236 [Mycena rosella]|uniref:Uncharacterized protein n=1 Tax=Mycena rosella TaxID=1033263 RepID=A0AAD7FVX2_MYCRO|nr:hypothetical protein B0H17DRAFT_1148236 [Mycena rosella]
MPGGPFDSNVTRSLKIEELGMNSDLRPADRSTRHAHTSIVGRCETSTAPTDRELTSASSKQRSQTGVIQQERGTHSTRAHAERTVHAHVTLLAASPVPHSEPPLLACSSSDVDLRPTRVRILHSSRIHHGWVARAGVEKRRSSSTSRQMRIHTHTQTHSKRGHQHIHRDPPPTQRSTPRRVVVSRQTSTQRRRMPLCPPTKSEHDARSADSVRGALVHPSALRIRLALRRTAGGAQPEGRVGTPEETRER